MEAVEGFKQALGEVEKARGLGDYVNAHARLLAAVQQYLTKRYSFDVSPADYGVCLSLNGYVLGAVGAVAHGVIRGRTKLEDIQRVTIGQMIHQLSYVSTKLRMVVVRDEKIKAAIIRDMSDQLCGAEIWTTDDLIRFDIPIRG